MKDLTAHTSRWVGWLLFVVGVLAAVAYATYELAVDDAVSIVEKAAVAAIVVGLLFLFLSVLRQRLLARKADRYEDVEL